MSDTSIIGDLLYDIAIGSILPTAFAVGGGAAVFGFNPNLYVLDLATGLIRGSVNIGDDPASLSVSYLPTLNKVYAFVGQRSSTHCYWIDISSTPNIVTSSTQSFGTFALYKQQASFIHNSFNSYYTAFFTSSPGNIAVCSSSGPGGTPSQFSLGTGLSSVHVTSLTNNPTNGNIVVACDDGHVREYGTTQILNYDITLPSFIQDGLSTIKPICDSISFYPDGSRIIVTTAQGILFHLNYPSGTLIESKLISSGQNFMDYSHKHQVGVNPVVNGFLPMWIGPQQTSIQTVSVWNMSSNALMQVDEVTWPGADANMIGCAIDATTGTFVACWSGGGDARISVWKMNCLTGNSTSDTQTLSAGVPVASRIIRIPYFGPGRQYVESDTNEAAGLQTLPSAMDDLDYIELSIENSKTSSEQMDIRMYQA